MLPVYFKAEQLGSDDDRNVGRDGDGGGSCTVWPGMRVGSAAIISPRYLSPEQRANALPASDRVSTYFSPVNS